jgi:uncharacterized membrane protein YraQ (UPF0718 family)
MDKNIIIRIIFFTIIVPIIGIIVKMYIQKKRNKESIFVNKNSNSVNHQNFREESHNDSKNVSVSEFIDSYNHPEYFTSTTGYLALFFVWAILGIGFPYFLLFLIFDLLIISIFAGIILNIIFIFLLKYSINLNKNKVLINLYTDKLSFSKKSQIIFEIPFNAILNLQILVERSYTVYPDEYIHINVNPEYFDSVIEPILSTDKSIDYFKLIKIKFLAEQVIPLIGTNQTQFKEQFFKVINGDKERV